MGQGLGIDQEPGLSLETKCKIKLRHKQEPNWVGAGGCQTQVVFGKPTSANESFTVRKW